MAYFPTSYFMMQYSVSSEMWTKKLVAESSIHNTATHTHSKLFQKLVNLHGICHNVQEMIVNI